MNKSLVTCLILSVLAGSSAAIWAVMADWSWLAALGVYCLVGSLSLVTTALAAAHRQAKPAVVQRDAPRAAGKEPAYA